MYKPFDANDINRPQLYLRVEFAVKFSVQPSVKPSVQPIPVCSPVRCQAQCAAQCTAQCEAQCEVQGAGYSWYQLKPCWIVLVAITTKVMLSGLFDLNHDLIKTKLEVLIIYLFFNST